MKHWTRLGWTNVNAIEVQEFGGDPPLCEGGGGFDGLLAPEKKFGKRLTRPPAKGEEQEYLHL